MSQEIINVGASPNDGTGDPIRDAYIKCNNNFTELYDRAQTQPPPNDIGSPGDEAGFYAYDSNYFYYCYSNYDGNTVIWNKIAQTGSITVTGISNGTSNILIPTANGAVTFSVNGVSNTVVINQSQLSAGNIYSQNYTGTFMTLTDTLNVPFLNVTQHTNLGNLIDITILGGNTGQFLQTDGNGNLTWADTGSALGYSNANVANYLPIYSGNILSDVLTANSIIANSLIGSETANLEIVGGSNSSGNINPGGAVSISGGDGFGNAYAGSVYINAGVAYDSAEAATIEIISGFSNIGTGGNLYLAAGSTGIDNQSNATSMGGDIILFGGNAFSGGSGGNVNIFGGYATSPAEAGDGGNVNINAGSGNLGGINGGIFIGTDGNTTSITIGNDTPVNVSGNVTANYFIGDGSLLTNLPLGDYSNANVANYLPINTSNIQANYFIGDGSLLTGLPASYGNANVASYLPTYSGNLSANVAILNIVELSNLTRTMSLSTPMTASLPSTITLPDTVSAVNYEWVLKSSDVADVSIGKGFVAANATSVDTTYYGNSSVGSGLGNVTVTGNSSALTFTASAGTSNGTFILNVTEYLS